MLQCDRGLVEVSIDEAGNHFYRARYFVKKLNAGALDLELPGSRRPGSAGCSARRRQDSVVGAGPQCDTAHHRAGNIGKIRYWKSSTSCR